MSLKKHFTLWKPPSSKAMKLTEQDTLFTEGIIEFVEKYYYDNVRYTKRRQGLSVTNIETPMQFYEKGSRINDEKNNSDAKYEIHNFGCSWTYGWCLEQEQSFPHLLGDKDTTIHNYGAGGTGLDFAVKTLSEVYIPESRRQIFIITVPHFFRRTWFDDDGVVYKAWEVKEKTDINEYNQYFNFLHHYNILNTFVGRDKIIWGTWDGDLPAEFFDVNFEVFDMADDMLHPGPESHKRYAEKIKNVLQDRFK